MLCGVSWSLCCGSVSTVCIGWRMLVYASVVLVGDCWCIRQWCWLEAVSECCVVLTGDCWCMFQLFGLETQCILQWC